MQRPVGKGRQLIAAVYRVQRDAFYDITAIIKLQVYAYINSLFVFLMYMTVTKVGYDINTK